MELVLEEEAGMVPLGAATRPWRLTPASIAGTAAQERFFLGGMDELSLSPALEGHVAAAKARWHSAWKGSDDMREIRWQGTLMSSRLGAYSASSPAYVSDMDRMIMKAAAASGIARRSGQPLAKVEASLDDWATGRTSYLLAAAAGEFGVARGRARMPAEEMKAYGSICRATYEATQEYLSVRGIKEMPLFRGMAWRHWEETPESLYGLITAKGERAPAEAAMGLNSLSSFSADPRVAWKFAEGRVNRRLFGQNVTWENDRVPYRPMAAVIAVTVPAARVFSVPMSGLGCFAEAEVVLVGGEAECAVFPIKPKFKLPAKSCAGLYPAMGNGGQGWRWTSAGV